MKIETIVLLGLLAFGILFIMVKVIDSNAEANKLQIEQQNKIVEQQNKVKMEIDKQANIDNCQNIAYKTYSTDWNTNCKRSGVDKKYSNCSLPMYLADSLDKTLETERNNCILRYK